MVLTLRIDRRRQPMDSISTSREPRLPSLGSTRTPVTFLKIESGCFPIQSSAHLALLAIAVGEAILAAEPSTRQLQVPLLCIMTDTHCAHGKCIQARASAVCDHITWFR